MENERYNRIKSSLNRINQLMQELKGQSVQPDEAHMENYQDQKARLKAERKENNDRVKSNRRIGTKTAPAHKAPAGEYDWKAAADRIRKARDKREFPAKYNGDGIPRGNLRSV